MNPPDRDVDAAITKQDQEATLTSAILYTSLKTLTQTEAVRELAAHRQLTVQVAEGLGLKLDAVKLMLDLPEEAQQGMIDSIIDRFWVD